MSNALVIPNASVFEALKTAEVLPLNIVSEYWQPIDKGEMKRLIFNGVHTEQVMDTRSGEMVDLSVAYFIEPTADGQGKVLRNASKLLVGAFEGKPWFVEGESMFQITYLGKKKFSSGNVGDNWSIQELRLKKVSKPNTDDDVEL